MTAAAITEVTKKEITSVSGMEVVRGKCSAGSGNDFYVSKFGKILNVVISDETNAGAAKATWSGSKITITATQNDYVDLIVFGQ